jgi:hypothetical protein
MSTVVKKSRYIPEKLQFFRIVQKLVLDNIVLYFLCRTLRTTSKPVVMFAVLITNTGKVFLFIDMEILSVMHVYCYLAVKVTMRGQGG